MSVSVYQPRLLETQHFGAVLIKEVSTLVD